MARIGFTPTRYDDATGHFDRKSMPPILGRPAPSALPADRQRMLTKNPGMLPEAGTIQPTPPANDVYRGMIDNPTSFGMAPQKPLMANTADVPVPGGMTNRRPNPMKPFVPPKAPIGPRWGGMR